MPLPSPSSVLGPPPSHSQPPKPHPLVYAMSSFTAALDGQLSISEGDALTLLDDSNAFWALVRHRGTVDGGYVPAELLETPLERTARLNSLKNADIGLLSMDISNESSQVLTNGTLSLSRTPLEGRVSMKRSVQFSREHDAGVEKSAEVVVAEEEVEDNMSPLSSPDAGNEDGPSSLFQKIMSPNMSFKKPTWLGKYGLKPSKTSSSINKSHTPSLDLIRVYARDFTASSKFKTVVLDDAMTVSGLVGAALKRFKLSSSTSDGRNNHKLYYLSILRGNDHQALDGGLLITDILKKQLQDMSISERPECFQVYLNIRSGSSSSTSPNPAPSDVMPPRLTSLSQSPSPKIQSIFHSTMTSLGLKEQGGDHNSESLQTGKKASKVFMSQQRLSRRISMESRTGSLGDGETLTTGSAQSPSLPFESSLKKQETKKKIKSRLSMLQSTLTDFMSDTNRSSFLEVEGKKDEGLELSRFPDSVQKKDRAALNQPSDSSQKLKALFENLEADLVTLESGEDLSEIHVPRGRLRTPEELAASKTILYSDVSTETMETLEIIGLMSKNLDSLILQAAQVYGIAPSHQEV